MGQSPVIGQRAQRRRARQRARRRRAIAVGVVFVGGASIAAGVMQSRDSNGDETHAISADPRATVATPTTITSPATTAATTAIDATPTDSGSTPPTTDDAPVLADRSVTRDEPSAAPSAPEQERASAPPAEQPPPQPGPPGLAGQLLGAINADRGAKGVNALGWHGGLAGSAQSWADWIAQNTSFTHQDLSALRGLGLSHLGENLFVGSATTSAGEIESMWMGSSGHYGNIVNSNFTVVGVGTAIGPDGQVWVAVVFGG